jgi:sterol desaturase/sphingolipid hydroxylase (fatty acid hydroxylase superfamily)
MAKHYISNKRITPRLFDNEIMERLSHVHPIVVPIIYLPVVIYFIYRALVIYPMNLGTLLVLFISGLLFWTLFEYLAHRYIFHYEPTTNIGKKFMFIIHGIHHDYPKDPKRLVMPPSVSIPLAFITYGIFRIVLGDIFFAPFFSGFVLGYIFYDMIHYATHHFSMKNIPGGLWLQKYHSRHHYQEEEFGFGVSSPLWDYVFRTHFKSKSKNATQES